MEVIPAIDFKDGKAILVHTDGKSLTVTEERFVTTDDRVVSNVKMEVSGKEEREIGQVHVAVLVDVTFVRLATGTESR